MLDFRDVDDANFEEKASKLLEQIQLMNGSQTNISAAPLLDNSQASIIQDPGKGRCLFETRVRILIAILEKRFRFLIIRLPELMKYFQTLMYNI